MGSDDTNTDNVKMDVNWNLKAIHATEEEVGMYISDMKGVKKKIAIIDSGVDYSAELPEVTRVDFTGEEVTVSDLYDDNTGHGTSIAGIIGARENEGQVLGINPGADIYSLKVFDTENRASLSKILESIYWAIDNDMDIINMSFGTAVYSEALELAVKEADQAGILMIAAAGNGGKQNREVEYPAAFEEVMAVGAADSKGILTAETSKGEELDIAAPGENVMSTGAFQGYVCVGGTSIAAAHVTGAASLIWQNYPDKSADYICQLLKSTCYEVTSCQE